MERGNLWKEDGEAGKVLETYYVLIFASEEGKATYLLGILEKKLPCQKEVGNDDLEGPF